MIYEILLIKEEVEGSGSAAAGAKAVRWTLPTTKAPPNQDPSEVLMRTWPSIKPKRAELADAVPLRSTGSTALLYFAPVNRATEPRSSADGSFADTLKQWPGSHWAPLSMVLDSLRPLREAAFKFSADTVALIAALDGWLSETHFLPQTVVTLWNSAARSRLQQVVRNPGRERGGKGAVLKAAKAVVNPLFNAGLVLFPAGSNLDRRRNSVSSPAYADEHAVAEAEAVAAAKLLRTESYGPNAIPLSERSPEALLKDQPNWSDRFPLHKAAVVRLTTRMPSSNTASCSIHFVVFLKSLPQREET